MQWEISVTADTIIQHLLKFYDILWVIKAGLKENFYKTESTTIFLLFKNLHRSYLLGCIQNRIRYKGK